ncbi:ubiE, partial [Symbiodinium necroappetens]
AAAAITSVTRAAKSEDSEATSDEVVDELDPVTRSEEQGVSPATSRGYAGDRDGQAEAGNSRLDEVLSLEQLTSEEEPAEADSAKDAKAARRERKKALKAERRARRAQSPEERSAAKRKPCTLCQRPVDLLVRCRIDISQKWHMLCGRCWKKASGGVPDGDASHPHYRYGGLWKNRSAKVTTPSFSGAVKAKAEEDFDSAELLLQEAYKGHGVTHLERCSGRLRSVAESEVIEPCLVTIPEIAATAGTEPPGTAHADQVPAEQAHCGKTAVTEVECRMEG